MNELPIGTVGEIYIGGVGLARGYINKPSLTSESFVANPFREGERLYKTGDLGRYLEDGNIEFIGRLDDQVKIRGFRIELGEIENVLSGHPDVKQAVVLAREDIPGQKKLVGYVKAKETPELIDSLRALTTRYLPDYMQLAQIVVLDEFPLTPNGKLDKKALPAPEGREGIETYQEPQGELEQKLASIWSELLGIERIGRNDNFFSLGGDSIISIQLVSRAKLVGINFAVKQVFETPTVQGLVSNSTNYEIKAIPQGLMSGEVELLPIQKWFFARKLVNQNYYNQAMWFIAKESLTTKDKENLKRRLKDIYELHDTLRLRYTEEGKQYYHEDHLFEWQEVKLDNNDWNILEHCTRAQQGLDIINGPLSKVIWFENKNRQGLFWVIHHLLVDGVSWRILLDDLNAEKLAPKTYSYQAFVEYTKTFDLSKTIEYYQNKRFRSIDKDYKLKNNEEVQVNSIIVSLDQKYTQDFIQKAQSSYNTKFNDLLMTALILSIGKHTNQYNLWINLEGHGREGELDVSRTIGWFTSVYPVNLEVTNPNDLAGCIKEIKEQLRSVPDKGFGYGLYKDNLPDADVDISFNYLGQWDVGSHKGYYEFGHLPTGPSSDRRNNPAHALDINGSIQKHQLSFNFIHTQEFNKDTIQVIAQGFINGLKGLIDHCINPKNYGYTPSDFQVKELLTQQALDNILSNNKNIEDIYPASPMQIIMLKAYENSNGAFYHSQQSYKIRATISNPLDSLTTLVAILIQQHPILRTYFVKSRDRIFQIVKKVLTITINYKDLSFKSDTNKIIEQIIRLDAEKIYSAYDSEEPLFRIYLFKLANNSYHLFMSNHHAIIDGWSNNILLNRILESFFEVNTGQKQVTLDNNYKIYSKKIDKIIAQEKSYSDYKLLKQHGIVDETKKLSINTFSSIRKNRSQIQEFVKEKSVSLKSFYLFLYIKSFYNLNIVQNQPMIIGIVSNGRKNYLDDPTGAVGLYWNIKPLEIDSIKDITLENIYNKLSFIEKSEENYVYSSQLKESIILTFNYTNFHNRNTHISNVERYYSKDYYHYPINMNVGINNEIISTLLNYNESFIIKPDQIYKSFATFCDMVDLK